LRCAICGEIVENIISRDHVFPRAIWKWQETTLPKEEFAIVFYMLENEDVTVSVYNDRGASELFAKLFRNILRYNISAKSWYCYNGRIWTEDTDGMEAHRLAKLYYDALTAYSGTISENESRERYLKRVSVYGSIVRRTNLLKDARNCYYISSSDFDSNINLINCKNGTFELDTLTLREHRSEDMLTKIADFDYDESAHSELWDKFISDVISDDTDKIRYLQKAVGYAITGKANLEKLFILYGSETRNGKSTFISSISDMLGNTEGYASSSNPDMIALRKRDSRSASEDLARLCGCRFLSINEPPKEMILDVSLVKTLTGNDRISVRRLYENSFEYKPAFTMFINTNHLPKVLDDTLFTSERAVVISFDRHFDEDDQDKNLKEKLGSEECKSAIFNWCTEGLKLYREEGLKQPESVRKSVDIYARTTDKLYSFFDDCMEQDENKSVACSEVYHTYVVWCRNNGYSAERKSAFYDMLRKKNLLAERATINGKTVNNVITGYCLSVL